MEKGNYNHVLQAASNKKNSTPPEPEQPIDEEESQPKEPSEDQNEEES